MAIAGRLAAFYIHESEVPVQATKQAMATIAGSTSTYEISGASKRYWDSNSNITVYVGGSATSSDLYGVEWSGGRVTFTDGAPSSPSDVEVSAYYFVMSQIGGGFNWTMTASNNVLDAPEFQKDWMYRVPGLNDWNCTVERWWANDGCATLFERNKEIHVRMLHDTSSGSQRYEGRGKFDTDDINAPTEELISQSLSIAGEGSLYYRN